MLLSLMLGLAAPDVAQKPECSFDRSAMLSLGQHEFDQNPDNGWRRVAAAGCDEVAADLIRDWRLQRKIDDIILYWHEGQLRANSKQYEAATKLFELSRKSKAEDAGWGWNLYVDGSIAFIKGDKTALLKARKKLAKLPKPKNIGRVVDTNGNPVELEWPMNLPVLDAFIRCWGQSYKNAYACPPTIK